MQRLNRYERIGLGILAVIVASFTLAVTSRGSDRFVSVSHSVSQRFVSIPSQATLDDLCFRLQAINGVTGVSYRDFSLSKHTAIVTVFFDPARTNPREIRIFMSHPAVLWTRPLRT